VTGPAQRLVCPGATICYPFDVAPDENGTFLITAPETNVTEATGRALEAIETAIQGRITDREDIRPTNIGQHFVSQSGFTARCWPAGPEGRAYPALELASPAGGPTVEG
jgi:hypothetical protein